VQRARANKSQAHEDAEIKEGIHTIKNFTLPSPATNYSSQE
jgi:hypothetical protein